MTASDQHSETLKTSENTASDQRSRSAPLCDTPPPITSLLFHDVITRGGYPLSPPPRDLKKRHVILPTLFKRSYFSRPLTRRHGHQTESTFAGNGSRSTTLPRQMFHLIGSRHCFRHALSCHALLRKIPPHNGVSKKPAKPVSNADTVTS